MIVGLGIDLVEIERIRRAMDSPRFVARILTLAEREYCHSAVHVAGRWAAKEAIAKALGLPLRWQEVEILPGEFGAPKATITSHCFDPVRMRVTLSITHERTVAAAVACIERLTIQVAVQ